MDFINEKELQNWSTELQRAWIGRDKKGVMKQFDVAAQSPDQHAMALTIGYWLVIEKEEFWSEALLQQWSDESHCEPHQTFKKVLTVQALKFIGQFIKLAKNTSWMNESNGGIGIDDEQSDYERVLPELLLAQEGLMVPDDLDLSSLKTRSVHCLFNNTKFLGLHVLMRLAFEDWGKAAPGAAEHGLEIIDAVMNIDEKFKTKRSFVLLKKLFEMLQVSSITGDVLTAVERNLKSNAAAYTYEEWMVDSHKLFGVLSKEESSKMESVFKEAGRSCSQNLKGSSSMDGSMRL